MADHPWCSDIARDTAIRAAEDAAASERPALPDHRELPERVARLEVAVFASQTNHDAAPTAGGGDSQCARHATIGGTQSGLRTERVTLEVTTSSGFSLDQWGWEHILRSQRGIDKRLQSVRVVPHSEADAEVERLRESRDGALGDFYEEWKRSMRYREERDAALARVENLRIRVAETDNHREGYRQMCENALSERDALKARVAELEAATQSGCVQERNAKTLQDDAERNGSASASETGQHADAEPVAWAATMDNGSIADAGTSRAEMAQISGMMGGTVVPLFRAPPPPRGWLTEEERSLIAHELQGYRLNEAVGEFAKRAKILSGLLSRNSPPRVRLPDAVCWPESDVPYYRHRDILAALAAAGVEVAAD